MTTLGLCLVCLLFAGAVHGMLLDQGCGDHHDGNHHRGNRNGPGEDMTQAVISRIDKSSKICNNNGNYYCDRCHCYQGWEGDHCEKSTSHNSHTSHQTDTDNDPCNNHDCHHGACVVDDQTKKASCRCTDGYYGTTCLFENPCRNHNPCENGGSCYLDIDTVHDYACHCAHGFSGPTCHTVDHKVDPIVKSTTPELKSTPTTSSTATMITAAPATPVPVTQKPPSAPSSTVTTALPASATPMKMSTTASPVTKQYHCHAVQSVQDVATHTISKNANASECPSGENSGSDAFVMNHCDVDISMLWAQGQNVMSVCKTLPHYTPIATFSNRRYHALTGTAAIFIDCHDNVIRVALQTCDKGVRIEHFNATEAGYRNANNYFVIQSLVV